VKPATFVHLNVDARFKHCGGEVRFVLPPRSTGDMPTRQVPSLLKAVVRGYDWRTRIIDGRAWGRRTLSKQTGLDERHVSRILQCTFLAPDIVEAILKLGRTATAVRISCAPVEPLSFSLFYLLNRESLSLLRP